MGLGTGEIRHAALTIETQSGPKRLDVEVADTDFARERGLMFRRSLPSGQGMIFLFGREHEISMWMKNTYISLDMVFISQDWHIVHITRNTEPQSTDIISSVRPAATVLEIGGDEASRLGLQVGDHVQLTQ